MYIYVYWIRYIYLQYICQIQLIDQVLPQSSYNLCPSVSLLSSYFHPLTFLFVRFYIDILFILSLYALNWFLVGQVLTPPPPLSSLVAIGTFFCLKIAENGFWPKKIPTFYTKRAIFFAKMIMTLICYIMSYHNHRRANAKCISY